MRKDFGPRPYLFPQPVLMIATYGPDDQVNVMNMAWGGLCAENLVALNLYEGHRTSKNIKARRAFTISIADAAHIEAADLFGIVSGNSVPDKFERTGLTATRSRFVDAPIVEEFPVTLECKVVSMESNPGDFRVVGQIMNASAREDVLDENGQVDPARIGALIADQFKGCYYAVGENLGPISTFGRKLMGA